MKKIIVAVISIIVLGVGAYFLVSAIANSSMQETKNQEQKVNKAIAKLKKYPEYSDLTTSQWNDLKNNVLQSKEGEFEQNFDWVFGGSLEKYNSEKKLGLISLKSIEEKIKNKESFVVMYSQTRCPHCLNLKNSGYEKWAEKMVKDGKKIYMLNLNLHQKPWTDKRFWNSEKSVSKSDSDNIAVPGTPAVAYFKNGKMSSGITEEKFDKVKNWFNKLDFK